MEKLLPFTILPQPTEMTCGPTCLHAVYKYYNDPISLDSLIDEIPMLEDGGTLAVFLGCHALQRGYKVTIYTYNLQLFDPTWFCGEKPASTDTLKKKLSQQAHCKKEPKLHTATNGYLKFLSLDGQLKLHDLNSVLVRKYLKKGVPIITGLSATYLHRSAREMSEENCEYNDICGMPSGHFVVLYGYNREHKQVYVAEPLLPNPVSAGQYYNMPIDRIICSILLGVITYDANLLIIEKKNRTSDKQSQIETISTESKEFHAKSYSR